MRELAWNADLSPTHRQTLWQRTPPSDLRPLPLAEEAVPPSRLRYREMAHSILMAKERTLGQASHARPGLAASKPGRSWAPRTNLAGPEQRSQLSDRDQPSGRWGTFRVRHQLLQRPINGLRCTYFLSGDTLPPLPLPVGSPESRSPRIPGN